MNELINKIVTRGVEEIIPKEEFIENLKKNKKYAVHDEDNISKIGDTVRIIEAKPISKTKRFILFNEKKAVGKK